MPKVYIEREAANEFFCQTCDTSEGTFCVRCDGNPLKSIPAADVVGVPEWMTKDELLDILRAAREGRLKITAPQINTTCGSCRHFQPYPGMASGKCDCRTKRNRRGETTGEVLYVTQSHKACRDDYERRADPG